MPGKRTIEELREMGAQRQRRWRERHLAFAKLKEKNAARLRRGTMERMAPAPNVHLTNADMHLTNGVLAPNVIVPRETYYEDMALVEGEAEVVREHAREVSRRNGVGIPAGLMELERGGHGSIERKPAEDSDGTPGVAGEHSPGEGVRTLSGAPKRVGSLGTGFKPGDEGGGVSGGQEDESGALGEDSGRFCQGPKEEAQSENEKETYRRLRELLRARQAAGELNAGVEVELEL